MMTDLPEDRLPVRAEAEITLGVVATRNGLAEEAVSAMSATFGHRLSPVSPFRPTGLLTTLGPYSMVPARKKVKM